MPCTLYGYGAFSSSEQPFPPLLRATKLEQNVNLQLTHVFDTQHRSLKSYQRLWSTSKTQSFRTAIRKMAQTNTF